MRFTLIRIWVRLLAVLIPRPHREAWVREWDRELRHRVPARPFDNILRDARFTRRQTVSEVPESRPSPIFLIEAISLAAATLLWFAYTRPSQEPPCGEDLNRIAFVQRSYATMGIALSSITWRLERELTRADAFEGTASFRIRHGFSASAQVSRNFFNLLGVKPAYGKTFDPESTLESVVISWAEFQSRFNANPQILGQRAWFDDQFLRVIGVLPANFVFASRRVNHFTPLVESALPAGLVVKLKEGVSIEAAQDTLRLIAPQVERGWKPEAYRLQPFTQVTEWRHTALPALAVALICWLFSSLYLYRKTRGSLRYLSALGGRLLLSIFALTELFVVIGLWSAANLIPLAIVLLWFYSIVCTLVCVLIVRDHLGRCPVCLVRLRMPTSSGTWGSLMMDLPGTQYVCPKGHGWLHRDGSGHGKTQWNRLDSTWRDLFVP